jgi:hypothetical protein
MNKLVLMIALPLLIPPGLAQSRTCLRVMTVEELTRGAIYIARVKVAHAERANYRGMYGQLTVLEPVEVIEGDFTMKKINVLSVSNVRCAEDRYIVGQQMLVFLEPEDSLYHTLNYQYGIFPIAGEMVKGWRDKSNNACDRPYPEVRRDIEAYIQLIRNPQGQPAPTPTPMPIKPPL